VHAGSELMSVSVEPFPPAAASVVLFPPPPPGGELCVRCRRSSKVLKMVYVLMDSRRGVMEVDLEVEGVGCRVQGVGCRV